MMYELGELINHKCGHGFRHKDAINTKGLPVINGHNFSGGLINTNYSMYMPDNFKYKYHRYILHPGDILIATIGDVGQVARFTRRNEICLLNQHIYDIKSRNNKILNNSYLYWLLNSNNFQYYIEHINRGSVQSFIPLHSILHYKIMLPPVDIQRKQALLLNILYKKIHLNNQIGKYLVKLLNLYFLLISNNISKKGVSTLDNIAHSVKVRADKKNLIYKRYIPINMIPKNQLFSSNYESYLKAKSSLIYFKRNDILFGAMRPYFHRLMVAPFNGVTRTTTIVIRPNESKLLPFLATRLFQNDFIKYASSHCKGSTMPYNTWDTIKNFKISIPVHLYKFNKVFNLINYYIYKLNLENSKISKFKTLILDKIFN